MKQCIIAQSSITYAVKARDLLAEMAVRARIIKLDSQKTKKGCAYGLEVDCPNMSNCIALLDRYRIPYSEVIS